MMAYALGQKYVAQIALLKNQMQNISREIEPDEIRELVGDAPVFIECGSHEGSHTVKFLAAMPEIRLHCFEPDKRPIARFKKAIGDDPRVSLYEVAVADINGYKSFYASTGKAGDREDWDFSGSLQRPTRHLTRSPEIKFKPPVKIPCIRLDTWLAGHPEIKCIDFAWIDIQGGQRSFIAGAQTALLLTRWLYIEAHHEPLYAGETTHDELIALLSNFKLQCVYARDNLLLKNRYP